MWVFQRPPYIGCIDDAVAHVTLPGHFPRGPRLGVWGARAPTRRDSRHTPSHARAGCGPGKLTTDPEEAERLSRVWDRTRGGGLGLRAPHFSRTPCQLLVLLVLSKIE